MITINCKDRSDNRLFFAASCLKYLTGSDPRYYLSFDQTALNKYEPLFNFLPYSKIKRSQSADIDLIFTNAEYLETSLKNKNALIFPIIFPNEIEKYQRVMIALDDSSNLIPIATKNNVFVPEATWVSDFIYRKLKRNVLRDKRVLISAGPTIEDIDPVRFLTNRSTGKMGIALARAAFALGADVTLVSGPTTEPLPEYCRIFKIRSAEQMAETIIKEFDNCDIYLGSAAIADFTPINYADSKIKKKDGILELRLKHTRDILAELSGKRKQQVVVGFSVETNDEIENSKAKMEKKNLDMIVINNPRDEGAAFAAETNLVTILKRNGGIIKLPLLTKYEVGLKIFENILKNTD